MPTAIHLIVNADDLGSGVLRDDGIFRAFREGIVTSASLLANGPSFATAVRQAQALELPLGVHLNLGDGPALTGRIPGLTDEAGIFFGKTRSRHALAAGAFDRGRAAEELAAQVDRALAAGVVPDHLDTHQHFGLFPAATHLTVATAERYGIAAVRLPLPMEAAAADPDGPLGTELALYRLHAPRLRSTLRQAQLHCPDGLWGMPLLDRLDATTLVRLLEEMPAGTWELMVHPGFAAAGVPFSGVQREIELAALTSASVRQAVEKRAIRLIAFGDLPCAS